MTFFNPLQSLSTACFTSALHSNNSAVLDIVSHEKATQSVLTKTVANFIDLEVVFSSYGEARKSGASGAFLNSHRVLQREINLRAAEVKNKSKNKSTTN